MSHSDTVVGLTVCRCCPTQILDLLARKTDGLCVPCFTDDLNRRLGPLEAELEGATIAVVRKRHRSGDRAAQRKRYKRKPDVAARRAKQKLAGDRAMRRLRRLMPGLYEALLAEERRKVGLDAWSLDRLLSPHDIRSSLDDLDALSRWR
jgi:hypothetical protein